MSPGFYFATHSTGWRSVVEIREALPSKQIYVVTMNAVGRYAVTEFSDWAMAMEWPIK